MLFGGAGAAVRSPCAWLSNVDRRLARRCFVLALRLGGAGCLSARSATNNRCRSPDLCNPHLLWMLRIRNADLVAAKRGIRDRVRVSWPICAASVHPLRRPLALAPSALRRWPPDSPPTADFACSFRASYAGDSQRGRLSRNAPLGRDCQFDRWGWPTLTSDPAPAHWATSLRRDLRACAWEFPAFRVCRSLLPPEVSFSP
jgi:hypothetical protein